MMNQGWDSHCRNQSQAFRLLINIVSQQLPSTSLDEVKYQCKDYIGRGKLERIKSFIELFTVLEERDAVSSEDVEFLICCLNNIHRKDLAKFVKNYAKKWTMPEEPAHLEGKAFVYEHQPKAFSGYSKFDSVEQTGSLSENASKNETEALPFPTAGYVVDHQTFARRRLNTTVPDNIITSIEYMTEHLSSNWQITMRFLGIGDEIITAATYNWPHDIKRQIKETLEHWARSIRNPTKEALVEAARASGRNDIAEELEFYR